LVVPCSRTVEEMRSFVRGENNKPAASKGAHDDMVMSLAIAVATRMSAMQRGGWVEPARHYETAQVSQAAGY